MIMKIIEDSSEMKLGKECRLVDDVNDIGEDWQLEAMVYDEVVQRENGQVVVYIPPTSNDPGFTDQPYLDIVFKVRRVRFLVSRAVDKTIKQLRDKEEELLSCNDDLDKELSEAQRRLEVSDTDLRRANERHANAQKALFNLKEDHDKEVSRNDRLSRDLQRVRAEIGDKRWREICDVEEDCSQM